MFWDEFRDYQDNPLTVDRERKRAYIKSSIHDIVTTDEAIQKYLLVRNQTLRPISKETNTRIRTACYHFLQFCNVTPSNHAFTDLINRKRLNPTDTILDQELRDFYHTKGTRHYYGSLIRQIFNANGIQLFPSIDLYGNSLHLWQPRKKRSMQPQNEIVNKDPAIQHYFDALKVKTRNKGYVSPTTYQHVYQSASKFLRYLQLEITSRKTSSRTLSFIIFTQNSAY